MTLDPYRKKAPLAINGIHGRRDLLTVAHLNIKCRVIPRGWGRIPPLAIDRQGFRLLRVSNLSRITWSRAKIKETDRLRSFQSNRSEGTIVVPSVNSTPRALQRKGWKILESRRILFRLRSSERSGGIGTNKFLRNRGKSRKATGLK